MSRKKKLIGRRKKRTGEHKKYYSHNTKVKLKKPLHRNQKHFVLDYKTVEVKSYSSVSVIQSDNSPAEDEISDGAQSSYRYFTGNSLCHKCNEQTGDIPPELHECTRINFQQFGCFVCRTYIAGRGCYSTHLRSIHPKLSMLNLDDKQTLRCDICHTTRVTTAQKHLREHLREIIGKDACSLCGKSRKEIFDAGGFDLDDPADVAICVQNHVVDHVSEINSIHSYCSPRVDWGSFSRVYTKDEWLNLEANGATPLDIHTLNKTELKKVIPSNQLDDDIPAHFKDVQTEYVDVYSSNCDQGGANSSHCSDGNSAGIGASRLSSRTRMVSLLDKQSPPSKVPSVFPPKKEKKLKKKRGPKPRTKKPSRARKSGHVQKPAARKPGHLHILVYYPEDIRTDSVLNPVPEPEIKTEASISSYTNADTDTSLADSPLMSMSSTLSRGGDIPSTCSGALPTDNGEAETTLRMTPKSVLVSMETQQDDSDPSIPVDKIKLEPHYHETDSMEPESSRAVTTQAESLFLKGRENDELSFMETNQSDDLIKLTPANNKYDSLDNNNDSVDSRTVPIVIQPDYVSRNDDITPGVDMQCDDVTPGVDMQCDDVTEDNFGYDDVKEEEFGQEEPTWGDAQTSESEKSDQDMDQENVSNVKEETNERIFVCDKCCVCFNSASLLSEHEVIHNITDKIVKEEPMSLDQDYQGTLPSPVIHPPAEDTMLDSSTSSAEAPELRIDSVFSLITARAPASSAVSSLGTLPSIAPKPMLPNPSRTTSVEPQHTTHQTGRTATSPGRVIIVRPDSDPNSVITFTQPAEQTAQDTDKFVCEFCHTSRATNLSLQRHIRSHHMKNSRYKCRICGIPWFSLREQLRHELTHSDCEWVERGFPPLDLEGQNEHARAYRQLLSVKNELKTHGLRRWRRLFEHCSDKPPTDRKFLRGAILMADRHEQRQQEILSGKRRADDHLKFECRICGLRKLNLKLLAKHEATHRIVEWTMKGLEPPDQEGDSLYAQERRKYLEKKGRLKPEKPPEPETPPKRHRKVISKSAWSDTELQFSCTECDAKFKDQIKLGVHMTKEHRCVISDTGGDVPLPGDNNVTSAKAGEADTSGDDFQPLLPETFNLPDLSPDLVSLVSPCVRVPGDASVSQIESATPDIPQKLGGASVQKLSTYKPSSSKQMTKRPKNAYSLWEKAARSEMQAAHPTEPWSVICQLMGEAWRKLSTEERKPYLEEAERLKAEYQERQRLNNAESANTSNTKIRPILPKPIPPPWRNLPNADLNSKQKQTLIPNGADGMTFTVVPSNTDPKDKIVRLSNSGSAIHLTPQPGSSPKTDNSPTVVKQTLVVEIVADTNNVSVKNFGPISHSPGNNFNSATDGSDSKPSQLGNHGNSADSHRIKRPMNAFMIWAKEARPKFASANLVSNAECSKLLGEAWRNLSDAERKPYFDRAEQLKAEHRQQHPGYRYRPQTKMAKGKQKVKSTGFEQLEIEGDKVITVLYPENFNYDIAEQPKAKNFQQLPVYKPRPQSKMVKERKAEHQGYKPRAQSKMVKEKKKEKGIKVVYPEKSNYDRAEQLKAEPQGYKPQRKMVPVNCFEREKSTDFEQLEIEGDKVITVLYPGNSKNLKFVPIAPAAPK